MRTSERNIYSFLRRHQIIIASVFLALFSLHLALTDKKEFARGYLLKEILSYTVVPVQGIILAAGDGVRGAWSDYLALVGVKRDNEALQKALWSLKEENNRLREEILLNARLRELLEYREPLPYSATAAGITGLNMERWTRTVTVNKGRLDGIEKDHAVISPKGIVGRIIEVNNFSSRVLLTTDLRSNVDVIVQRTRVKGVVEGNGTDGLVLKYVRQVDDVKEGDLIVTSGLSGIFPKGLVVGEVAAIEKGTDNFFKHIEIRPSVPVSRLEEVLILKERSFDAE